MIVSGSELSFLLDLLLEHKLPATTKLAIAARLKHVESTYGQQPQIQAPRQLAQNRPIAASTEAQALAASLAAAAASDMPVTRATFAERWPKDEPIPAAAVGVTSAAADAMAQRNRLIAEAQAGIAKKGPAVGRGHGTK